MKYIFALFLVLLPSLAQAQSYGIALHGEPKYNEGFTHFDYVNPDAPKGGAMTTNALGTFDSLNIFITKGVKAASMGLIYQSLMTSSADEAFSKYGDLAQSVQVADDLGSVTFKIHPDAVWHDGKAITATDVVWSFNTLIAHGAPHYKSYYADIDSVQAIDEKTVIFHFKTTENKELPLIAGALTILPKHYWTADGRDITKTTLDAPLGSGPYKLSKINPGKSLTFERVQGWWAADLPVNKGRYNFDTVTVQYYRDATVALEALFANEYDLREEYVAKNWAKSYDVDPVKSGNIIKENIKHSQPQGMQAFIMNQRRDVFKDRDVRHAIQYAFDYEWSNKKFAYGAYTRTDSYFENSELASSGVPEGRELEILNQFRDQLPPELFEKPYENPTTNGSGNNRRQLKTAIDILEGAGYKLADDGIRVHEETGQRLSFEIMHHQADFERWIHPFIQNLKRIGVEANFRVIDVPQFVERMTNFDFDMTIGGASQSLSPGNEQMEYWHSTRANQPGSRNHMGIKNPVIDALVEMVVNAPNRDELVTRTRALDRVLLWGYYSIPQFHIDTWRVAYWDKFQKPDIQAPYALGAVDTWWMKE